MKKISIIVFTTLSVILPISIFSYLLYKTRVISPIEICLQLRQDDSLKNTVKIDEDSIKKMNEELKKDVLVNDQNRLIEVFERERAKYIELLTIVSVILTIFSLFSLVSIFFQRNETENIKNEFKKLTIEFNKQLKVVKFTNIINGLNDINDCLRKNTKFLLNDNSFVDSPEKLDKYLNFVLNKSFGKMDNVFEKNDLRDFAICITNILCSVPIYMKARFHLDMGTKIDINTQNIPKTIITCLYNHLSEEQYNEIKRIITDVSPVIIKWGIY